MGARQLGQVRPNSVIAPPILPDSPLSGKGSSLSTADAVVAESTLSPTELRRQRGLAIAALCPIKPEGKDNRYRVPSQKGKGAYLVNIDSKKGPDWRCECKDFETRGEPCKHVFAVQFFVERERQPDIPAVATQQASLPERVTLATKTKAPRPTYKQDWPAYNDAQIHEKDRFQGLLAELCQGVQEPPRKRGSNPGGRIPIPMADRAFSVALKVYTTMSGRRASTDMRDARAKGYIKTAPHYSRVSRFLEDPAMTPILIAMISESALPLRAIEQDFAVDSSGFMSSRFVRWFDKKYGVVKEEHTWVKVHLMCGVKTNIVTAVRIGDRHDNDCPEFIPLVNATAGNFTIREVSADKQYLSYENMDAVAAHGGTPYIAFKEGSTGQQGGTYRKMYHTYCLNKDECFNHYHKRSNVESTYSMIKAKFGDSVRSKTDTAMVNEALCKVLCHNVCCLIQSACELGIEAKFWEDTENHQEKNVLDSQKASDEIDAWAWL